MDAKIIKSWDSKHNEGVTVSLVEYNGETYHLYDMSGLYKINTSEDKKVESDLQAEIVRSLDAQGCLGGVRDSDLEEAEEWSGQKDLTNDNVKALKRAFLTAVRAVDVDAAENIHATAVEMMKSVNKLCGEGSEMVYLEDVLSIYDGFIVRAKYDDTKGLAYSYTETVYDPDEGEIAEDRGPLTASQAEAFSRAWYEKHPLDDSLDFLDF